ncbi:MAG: ABC transporter ATP-binding protein [Candidatus Zipacnadales bacterium]
MAAVRLVSLTKDFGSVRAVDDLTLEIRDAEFLVLVGPSGCGKTTALRMIAGLEEATAGEIWIGDRLVNDVSPKDRDIAMVFQNYALYPHMTVFDNMAFGLKLRRVPRDEIKRRVIEAAHMLGLPESLLARKPKELSGGQRQRVALVRAIVREPAVFLMDEPLSNLDAKLRIETRAELIKLHRRLGITTIYVTHDQVEAMTMGDRIAVMREGKVQQVDTPLNLYSYPVNRFVAGFIGSPPMNFADATLSVRDNAVFVELGGASLRIPDDKADIARQHVGKTVEFGVRPSDIYDTAISPVVEPNEHNTVRAQVEVIEPMGADSILYLRLGSIQLVASVDSGTRAREQEPLDFVFDMDKAHLFDKETELTIF